MKQLHRTMALVIASSLLAACNLLGGKPPSEALAVQAQAATIVAATMHALATSAPLTTPVASPLPPVATSSGKPSLFINTQSTACRSGPGPDFKVIATFTAGTSLDLVGQDTADSYWIVRDPASKDTCWISIQDATPTGDFQSLPQMTPQPVTITLPGKPRRGVWNFSCDNTTLTTILAWNPTTGAVNGYRIYRKGSQIADVPASQTSYTEKIPFTYGSSMDYAVAAYNEAGTSPQVAWTFHCP